jgi:hypothetical protein
VVEYPSVDLGGRRIIKKKKNAVGREFMDSSAPCSLWLYYSLCCVVECDVYFAIKLKI